VHNWLAEARRFRPALRAVAYHGAGRSLDREADLVVTTYALLRLDADALAAEPWDAVVLDEAQAIKNPDSQTARAAYRLAAPFRLAMTGTPVENRLEELWSLLRFTNPACSGGSRRSSSAMPADRGRRAPAPRSACARTSGPSSCGG